MPKEQKPAWSRNWVIINSLATVAGAVTGLVALVIALIALVVAMATTAVTPAAGGAVEVAVRADTLMDVNGQTTAVDGGQAYMP